MRLGLRPVRSEAESSVVLPPLLTRQTADARYLYSSCRIERDTGDTSGKREGRLDDGIQDADRALMSPG